MNDVSVRVKQLKESFISREESLKKLSGFSDCCVVPFENKKVSFSLLGSEDVKAVIAKLGSEEFSVEKKAFFKLCRIAGIHESYVEKTPLDLFFPHMEFWINKGGFIPKALSHGKRDGKKRIIGFMKETSEYYPVTNVFTIADEISKDYVVEGMDSLSIHGGAIGFVFPEYEFPVDVKSVGDFLYGGVKIKFSFFGEFPISLSIFIVTLSCLNGMVSFKEGYSFNRKRMASIGEDMFVRDSIKLAFSNLKSEIVNIKKLAELKLDSAHIVPYVEDTFNVLRIGPRTRKVILEEIITKNPKTMYDLMNAITGAVKLFEDKRHSYRIQRLGGFIVNHVAQCPSCHRPI